jgi:copper homeostasis protein
MSIKPITVEIAAHSVQAALAAQSGGAHRVELFTDPLEGGVTPSEGLIALLRDRLKIPLHILIRPRAGDFCYCEAELDVMQRDIAAAKRIGVDGIVLGALTVEGAVDRKLTTRLIDLAHPIPVTFHRAIDMCRDMMAALSDVIASGASRVLTSGGQADACQGIPALRSLSEQAGNKLILIAAGGIRLTNVTQIVQATGIREVHAGLRTRVPGPMRFRNEKVSVGAAGSEFERLVVREEDVRALVEQVASL